VIQAAKRDGLPVRPLKPDRDKVSRSLVAAARLESGTVYWPRQAPWLEEWESELLLFPNGRFDDQVDTFSYAALEATSRRLTRPDFSGWRNDLTRVSPNII
jgi:predicted phage terminase large subunit-like protein